MPSRLKKRGVTILICAGFMVMVLGCAASGTMSVKKDEWVREGDTVRLDYTCRLPQGGVLTTTVGKTADDASIHKAEVFMPQRYQPVAVPAVEPEECETCGQAITEGLDRHIEKQIGRTLQGHRLGDRYFARLEETVNENLKKEERYLPMARVWRFPKTEKRTFEMLNQEDREVPMLGQVIPWRPGFAAKVADITDNIVTLEVNATAPWMDTHFGRGRIVDDGDFWRVEIDHAVGDLVRMEKLLGRVDTVDEQTFRMDFGHPFAGQALDCEVALIERVDSGPSVRTEKASPGETETVAGQAASTVAAVEAAPAATPAEAKRTFAGKSSAGSQAAGDVVAAGDLVMIHYVATLSDGRLVQTSRESVARDPEVPKAPVYQEAKAYGPEMVAVGQGQEMFSGLSQALMGKTVGQRAEVHVPAEAAFGASDPTKIKRYERIRRIPVTARMDAKAYALRFAGFPTLDKEVELTPYFKARVIRIDEDGVVFRAQVEDLPRQMEDPFGITEVSVDGDEVVLTLTPRIGGEFKEGEKTGRIVDMDETGFKVDFNPPMAGQTIDVAMEIVGLKKGAGHFAEIHWLVNHDEGLAASAQENKPMVLVLYASWCGWSKRLLHESLEDPRVRAFGGDFVWVKIDSDKEQQYKEGYDQKGFPMIVFLDAQGHIVEKIDGFADGRRFSRMLNRVLEETGRG